MERFRKLFLLTIVLLGLLFSSTVGLIGCGNDTTETKADDSTTVTATDDSTLLADRAIEVLAATPGPDYPGNSIAADKLTMMADPAQMDNIQLVDIRKKADYDKGHIEGAIQMEFLEWAKPENLSQIDKTKTVVVICYTGNTAAQATMGMRIIGIDAVALKGGMTAWVAGTGASTIADLQAANNDVVNDSPAMEAVAAPEATFTSPSGSDYDTLAAKMDEVFSAMPAGAANVITAADLKTKLEGPDKDTITVLDIRSTEDFTTVGHIEGR